MLKKGLVQDWEKYKGSTSIDFKDRISEAVAFLHFSMGWAHASKRFK